MNTHMKALVKLADQACVIDVPIPQAPRGFSLIKTEMVGVCRTDVCAAEGRIPVSPGTILGHELTGTIAQSTSLSIGATVTVNPVISCENCDDCSVELHRCQKTLFLGVQQNGALAEYITVADSNIHPISHSLDARIRAYAEPVCAAQGLIRLQLPKEIWLSGKGRIAELYRAVLQLNGHTVNSLDQPRPNSINCVVDCDGTASSINMALASLRQNGILALKSRHSGGQIAAKAIVQKSLQVKGNRYGDFADAVRLLESNPQVVSKLLGPVYSLDDWQTAFRNSEALKSFIRF